MKMYTARALSVSAAFLLGAGVTACARPQPAPAAPPVIEYQVRDVPGVVESAWEEPMVDMVEVPPGLDPEGIYYRPAHSEVVEIRQGRWQYYRKPSR
jgi:uncharacterized lipoprotein YmbA